MKPLAFNLSGAKKIASDKNSSTFQLKNSHQIKVSHSALTPEHRAMIEKIPLYAGGGVKKMDNGGYTAPAESSQDSPDQMAADATTQAPSQPAAAPNVELSQAQQALADAKARNADQSAAISSGISNAWNALTTPVDAPPAAETPAAAPLPDADPNLPGAGTPIGASTSGQTGQRSIAATPAGSSVDINGSYQQGQKAISEQQDVATQLAKSQADIQQKDLADRQDLQKTFQQNTQDFQTQQKQFMNDYMNNHINPNHYMENMDAGQKVATGIGLFLGGFSSAFTHQGNPAMDFLNKQIDRDIAGQQSRLDQQKTILGANQDLYHDQLLANNATRINMNDIYDHKIQLAASQLGTPQAQANADAAHSKFALENAQLLQQNALRATALQGVRNGGAGLDPVALGQAGFMTPEQATKEQGAYDGKKLAVDQGNQLYAQLAKTDTVGNRIAHPWDTGTQVTAMNAQLANNLLSAAPSKRYSKEMADALVEPFQATIGDDAARTEAKRQGYQNLIAHESAGEMPISSRYIDTSFSNRNPATQPQAASHKIGDIVYLNGQKGQVQPNGQIKAVR